MENETIRVAAPMPVTAGVGVLWSSHQQALTVGRLIERHHAQLRVISRFSG